MAEPSLAARDDRNDHLAAASGDLAAQLGTAGEALARAADTLERSHQANLRQMAEIRAASRQLDVDLEESRRAIEALASA